MILGISTSLSQFCITLNDNNQLVYHKMAERAINGQSDLQQLITSGLQETGISISSITGIVVDTGPGGTSSVRTGVSFANGLAYSLNIPIQGVSSAVLMGLEAEEQYKKPTATLFKSIKQNYFCGIYNNNKIAFLYTNIDDISQHLKSGFSEIVLAGNREGVQELGNRLQAIDAIVSDIQKVAPRVLGEYSSKLAGTFLKYPQLPTPITETNLS